MKAKNESKFLRLKNFESKTYRVLFYSCRSSLDDKKVFNLTEHIFLDSIKKQNMYRLLIIALLLNIHYARCNATQNIDLEEQQTICTDEKKCEQVDSIFVPNRLEKCSDDLFFNMEQTRLPISLQKVTSIPRQRTQSAILVSKESSMLSKT